MQQDNDAPQYNLGVALSGGGARGFAHLGALKALDETGFKPDLLAGVSAGSVAAVMYAAGLSPEEIIDRFASAKFSNFTRFSLGKAGLFDLSRFKKFLLDAIAPYKYLEELPIPTYIGATDFDHGRSVAFNTGRIGERVIASCSIPIVFPPVRIEGTNYVDGGVLRNLPSWIIRPYCSRLIGINCSPLVRERYNKSLLEIALHTYNLMAKANQAADMEMCDLNVTMPDIAHYKVFNLKQVRSVFISGFGAMRHALRQADWLEGDVTTTDTSSIIVQ